MRSMAKEMVWRIERIVTGVSIYEFFVWIQRPLERMDRAHQIHCPFTFAHSHGDIHPSARVFPDSNKIYCYTEAKGWDIIDAVGEYFGLSMVKAIEYIEKKKGWDRKIESKIVRQIKSAKRGKRKIHRKGNSAEDRILELVGKLRGMLSEDAFEFLGDVVVYVWDIYEQLLLRKASLEDQVEWELWAEALLKERAKVGIRVERHNI